MHLTACASLPCSHLLFTAFYEVCTDVVAQDLLDVGWFSVWVKLVTEVLTAALYLWTLAAPSILVDRNFS